MRMAQAPVDHIDFTIVSRAERYRNGDDPSPCVRHAYDKGSDWRTTGQLTHVELTHVEEPGQAEPLHGLDQG